MDIFVLAHELRRFCLFALKTCKTTSKKETDPESSQFKLMFYNDVFLARECIFNISEGLQIGEKRNQLINYYFYHCYTGTWKNENALITTNIGDIHLNAALHLVTINVTVDTTPFAHNITQLQDNIHFVNYSKIDELLNYIAKHMLL